MVIHQYDIISKYSMRQRNYVMPPLGRKGHTQVVVCAQKAGGVTSVRRGRIGEHAAPQTDEAVKSCTPETCVILLTNVTRINSVQLKGTRRTGCTAENRETGQLSLCLSLKPL